MHRQLARLVEVLRPEFLRRRQRHVALGTVRLGDIGIVETLDPVARDTRQAVAIVVVLAAHEVAVMIQFIGQSDLMTGRTELSGLVMGLQKSVLMEGWLRLHQLVVDPLQQRIARLCEWVMDRLFDREVCVADRAVHMRDGMTGGAGNPGVSGGVLLQIVVRVVECTAEERNRIVAASTPAGRLHITIPLHAELARLPNTGKVHGVVEGAEPMRAFAPLSVDIGMAAFAVVVHHQRVCRDEVPGGSLGQRRQEVFLALFRPSHVPFARIGRVAHRDRHDSCGHGTQVTQAVLPLNLRPGETMQDVEPDAKQRADDVSPVGNRPGLRLPEFEASHAEQSESRHQHDDAGREEGVPDRHCSPILTAQGVLDVDQTEHNERHNQQQPKDQVPEKHAQVEEVLIGPSRRPLHRCDRGQVCRVGDQQRQQRQHQIQQLPQLRANRLLDDGSWRHHSRGGRSGGRDNRRWKPGDSVTVSNEGIGHQHTRNGTAHKWNAWAKEQL